MDQSITLCMGRSRHYVHGEEKYTIFQEIFSLPNSYQEGAITMKKDQ